MSQRRVLEVLMGGGAIRRSKELIREGVAGATIRRALADGWLEKVSHGTYRQAGSDHEGGEQLAEALARTPRGVVCLHSAAALHGLGDTEPGAVWIAIPHAARRPSIDWPKVRWVRWRREASFTSGVSERRVCGVTVRATDPARTVIDMLDSRLVKDRTHGLRCLADYLATGGSGAELRMAAREQSVSAGVRAALDVALTMAEAA